MPFIQRPQGFSAETLAMLDQAMSELWLEHAALANPFAVQKAATPIQPVIPTATSVLTK